MDGVTDWAPVFSYPSCISPSPICDFCASTFPTVKRSVNSIHPQSVHRVSQVAEIPRGADGVPDCHCVHRFSAARSCQLWTGEQNDPQPDMQYSYFITHFTLTVVDGFLWKRWHVHLHWSQNNQKKGLIVKILLKEKDIWNIISNITGWYRVKLYFFYIDTSVCTHYSTFRFEILYTVRFHPLVSNIGAKPPAVGHNMVIEIGKKKKTNYSFC